MKDAADGGGGQLAAADRLPQTLEPGLAQEGGTCSRPPRPPCPLRWSGWRGKGVVVPGGRRRGSLVQVPQPVPDVGWGPAGLAGVRETCGGSGGRSGPYCVWGQQGPSYRSVVADGVRR